MKLAVLSESPADEAAIRILVDGVLGTPAEPVCLDKFLGRTSWPGILNVLPAVLKEVYFQTHADALVVVADSDRSPVHEPLHDAPGKDDPKCRLCLFSKKLDKTLGHLRAVPGRGPLRCALGLAVPTMEAWLRCGVDRGVTESAWMLALKSRQYPYDSRRLKMAVYGTDRPTLQLERRRMIEEASRIAAAIGELESQFPVGFGELARVIRSW